MTIANVISLDRARNLRSTSRLVDPVVAHWKCRVGICLTRVGVTETAVFALQIFNDELKRHRLTPIAVDEVMLCTDHANWVDKNRRWK